MSAGVHVCVGVRTGVVAYRKGKQLDILAAPLYDLSSTTNTPSAQLQGAPVMYSRVNGTLRSWVALWPCSRHAKDGLAHQGLMQGVHSPALAIMGTAGGNVHNSGTLSGRDPARVKSSTPKVLKRLPHLVFPGKVPTGGLLTTDTLMKCLLGNYFCILLSFGIYLFWNSFFTISYDLPGVHVQLGNLSWSPTLKTCLRTCTHTHPFCPL